VKLRRLLLMTVWGAALCGWSATTWARANGIASGGCVGCHKGPEPMVTITVEPMVPAPGATAVVSVHISRADGNFGGFYLRSNGKGSFSPMTGPVRLISATEVVHSSPAPATGNEVLFQVRWTAPPVKGNVDFETWAVSSNGNGQSGGDGGGDARVSTTYGCEGVPAFLDNDHDGFGRDWDATRLCELTGNYVAKGGDCDDNNAANHPGAPEICDYYDNNCDGMINEGLPIVLVYRDLDRDGHGDRKNSDTQMRCATWPGYSAMGDDCDDLDKDTHPGADELCDSKDNDCNGRIDDGARASCGEGWCRRLAASCSDTSCTPGKPRKEMCNAFDDDCDGVIDNGTDLCEPGKTCFGGYCLTSNELADAAAAAARMEPVPEPSSESDGGIINGGLGGDNRRRSLGCAFGGAAPSGLLFLLLALAVIRRKR
jgi:hypothetical protein